MCSSCRTLQHFLVDYSELAPNDPILANPTVQNLSTEAAEFCYLLHVDIDSTISIDDKIDLADRMNYGSVSRPEPSSLPLETEPVVKLEATEPEAHSYHSFSFNLLTSSFF